MSTILAIDTSTDLASAALLMNGRVIVRESSGVHTHSQSILPLVHGLLREGDIALARCDGIAFGCGPGSFTGLRTACGITQGLAFGAGLPVLPVVTLMAMAHACRQVSGADDVLAVLDARMGEVYWAQYRYADGWQTVIAPQLSAAAQVTPDGKVIACGNGLAAYAAQFDASLLDGAIPGIAPHAAQIAELGAAALARGEQLPAADAQPLYLRNKVALTTAERAQKAGAAA